MDFNNIGHKIAFSEFVDRAQKKRNKGESAAGELFMASLFARDALGTPRPSDASTKQAIAELTAEVTSGLLELQKNRLDREEEENKNKLEKEKFITKLIQGMAHAESALETIEDDIKGESRQEIFSGILAYYSMLVAFEWQGPILNIQDKELYKSAISTKKHYEKLLLANNLPGIDSVRKYLLKVVNLIYKIRELECFEYTSSALDRNFNDIKDSIIIEPIEEFNKFSLLHLSNKPIEPIEEFNKFSLSHLVKKPSDYSIEITLEEINSIRDKLVEKANAIGDYISKNQDIVEQGIKAGVITNKTSCELPIYIQTILLSWGISEEVLDYVEEILAECYSSKTSLKERIKHNIEIIDSSRDLYINAYITKNDTPKTKQVETKRNYGVIGVTNYMKSALLGTFSIGVLVTFLGSLEYHDSDAGVMFILAFLSFLPFMGSILVYFLLITMELIKSLFINKNKVASTS